MTKKDYEAIANIIRSMTMTVDHGTAAEGLRHQKVLPRTSFVNELCAYLKRDNLRFDPDRFKKAIEPNYVPPSD